MASSISSQPTSGHLSRCENYSNVGRGTTNSGKYQKGIHIKAAEREASAFRQKELSQNARLEAARARLQSKLSKKYLAAPISKNEYHYGAGPNKQEQIEMLKTIAVSTFMLKAMFDQLT